MLNKRYGKFKLWQLIALGAAIGLAVYLYRRNTTGGEYADGLGASWAGTGTGAFGPINPDTGVPYAFEGGGQGGEGLDSFLDKIQQMKDAGLWGGEQEPSVIETNTETIVQEPGEAQPLANPKPKSGKPKRTGSAANKALDHRAPKHPKQRIGIGPAKSLGKVKPPRGPKAKKQRKPKQQKPRRQRQARKPKRRRKVRR